MGLAIGSTCTKIVVGRMLVCIKDVELLHVHKTFDLVALQQLLEFLFFSLELKLIHLLLKFEYFSLLFFLGQELQVTVVRFSVQHHIDLFDVVTNRLLGFLCFVQCFIYQ